MFLGQGMKIGEVIRKLGISEQTYYRWRKEYGGMRVDQARLKKERAFRSLNNRPLFGRKANSLEDSSWRLRKRSPASKLQRNKGRELAHG